MATASHRRRDCAQAGCMAHGHLKTRFLTPGCTRHMCMLKRTFLHPQLTGCMLGLARSSRSLFRILLLLQASSACRAYIGAQAFRNTLARPRYHARQDACGGRRTLRLMKFMVTACPGAGF